MYGGVHAGISHPLFRRRDDPFIERCKIRRAGRRQTGLFGFRFGRVGRIDFRRRFIQRPPDGADALQDVGLVPVLSEQGAEAFVCAHQFGDTADHPEQRQAALRIGYLMHQKVALAAVINGLAELGRAGVIRQALKGL